MAVRPQIPRFGNWDKDDVPYSVYFENARRERSGARINPNDPVENPAAFKEKEAVEDGSDFERNSADEQRNGKGGFANAVTRSHSDRPRIEINRGAPSDDRDDGAFNRTGSIKSFDRLSSSERKYPRFSKRWTETQQHQRRPSIPKFGSWTDNKVQYAAHFENARKDKAGFKINPNDLEENRDAFWFRTGSQENYNDFSPERTSRLNPGSSHQSRRRKPVKSMILLEGTRGTKPIHNDRQITATSTRNEVLQRSITNTYARGNAESYGRSNEIQPYHSPVIPSQGTPSAPAFVRWGETDPNSGEGYSDTFFTVKDEKETESGEHRPPPALPVPANSPNYKNCRKKQGGLFSRLKASCCLYADGKE